MAGNFIKRAVKRPGAFSAKARAAGMSTAAYAQKMRGKGGRTGAQARLAITLMRLSRRRKKA